MIGKTLAHYQISALLGKGGMGEVFRAQDTKLGREVAIKVLPKEMSGDPERAARFDREARTLASLQHPNIASIYGFEEVEGQRFLVMELVEGTELGDRIPEDGMPMDEVERIAGQLAMGLEAAHERGIVHRDLKPANIMIDPNGNAKILDFGLARAWFGDVGDDTVLANSPTITAAMTQAGTILGTAAYMSPEQARGRNVDPRADIWAFGAILWEMVTGRRLFEGETISDTLAAVLRAEPQWALLPVDEAPYLCRLIERCLVRDPRVRLRDIGEARILLSGDANQSSIMFAAGAADLGDAETVSSRGSARLGWIAAIFMAVIAVALGTTLLTRQSAPSISRATLALPSDAAINFAVNESWSSLQFSKDGQSLAYIGGRPGQLYLRSIDSFEATPFASTEGARLPVFSPDGRWIAYFANSKIWKIAVSGGAPVELCDASAGPGLAWGEGELYYCRALGGGLWAISEDGGEPREISTLNSEREETSHRFPQLLPDGRHLLFTIKTARIASFDDALIAILSLDTGETQILMRGGSNPRYMESGHIVYARDSQLFRVAFDPQSLSLEGTPVAVLDGIQTEDSSGTAYFALSSANALAYVPAASDKYNYTLAWLDRDGVEHELEQPLPFSYGGSHSPDKLRFATVIAHANDKIWIYDTRQKSIARLTSTPGNDGFPVWSPDGQSIIYANDLDGPSDLYRIAANGSGEFERLTDNDFSEAPSSWSPDGSELLITRATAADNEDIWVLSMGGEHELAPLLSSAHNERSAQFSPDGSYFAYVSDAGGEEDVYIRSYPEPGSSIRVSRSGGDAPAWSQDGRTLFFVAEGNIMEAQIDRSEALRIGDIQPITKLPTGFDTTGNRPSLDAGEQRFLMFRWNLDSKQDQIRVIFDWESRWTDLAAGAR